MKKMLFMVAFLTATLPGAAAQPVEIRVTPQAAESPATVRVTVVVEPDSANRELTIRAECSSFLRSSSFSLEGAGAPTTHTRTFSGLPAGTYEVSATLVRNDGTEVENAIALVVFGPPH